MAHNPFGAVTAPINAEHPPLRLSARDVLYIFALGWCVPYAAFIGLGFGLPFLVDLRPETVAESQFLRWLYGERNGLTWNDYLFVGVVITAEIIAIYLVAIRRKALRWSGLGIRPANAKWFVFAAFLFLFSEAVFNTTISVAGLEAEAEQFARRLLLPADRSLHVLLVSLILFGPLVAFVEESFFRGIIYRWFRIRFGIMAGLSVSSILFGAVHFYYFDPGGDLGWIITAYIFVFGLVAALLFEASKSLWPSIFLHATANIVGTVVVFIS